MGYGVCGVGGDGVFVVYGVWCAVYDGVCVVCDVVCGVRCVVWCEVGWSCVGVGW